MKKLLVCTFVKWTQFLQKICGLLCYDIVEEESLTPPLQHRSLLQCSQRVVVSLVLLIYASFSISFSQKIGQNSWVIYDVHSYDGQTVWLSTHPVALFSCRERARERGESLNHTPGAFISLSLSLLSTFSPSFVALVHLFISSYCTFFNLSLKVIVQLLTMFTTTARVIHVKKWRRIA